MNISWLILTYNRSSSVLNAIPHCMKNAGRPWHEIIWVDNGSCHVERESMNVLFKNEPNCTRVFNHKNLGVAKGYNTAMALARGTHMVITGCDMLMPNNWLDEMCKAFELIPNLGIVSIYASPIDKTPERIRGPKEVVNGIKVQPAMPIGRRMLSVELQRSIGYFNEGFGMYGWDDVVWGHTAERVCKEKGLLSYNLYDKVAEHLGTEGNVGYDHKDEHEYWRWKKKEVDDPKKQVKIKELSSMNWPSYHPY